MHRARFFIAMAILVAGVAFVTLACRATPASASFVDTVTLGVTLSTTARAGSPQARPARGAMPATDTVAATDTGPAASLPDTVPTASLPDTGPAASLPDTVPTASPPDTDPAASLPDTGAQRADRSFSASGEAGS